MLTPIEFLRQAVRAVPAVKYALGVGGIVATVAIVYSFKLDPRVAFVGTVIMLVLMGVLVIFARMAALPSTRLHVPALTFTWFVLLLFMATSVLLFTSVFFDKPLPLRRLLQVSSVPTEDKLVAAVSQGEWRTECSGVIPAKGWQLNSHGIEAGYDLLPGPGSYWAQYDLRLSSVKHGVSQVDYIYAYSLDWQSTSRNFPGFERDLYARIMDTAALYPPKASIPWAAREIMFGDSSIPAKVLNRQIETKIAGTVSIRRTISYEDGSEVDTLTIPVARLNADWRASITLLPYVEAYPNWSPGNPGSDPPIGTEYTCSANNKMNLRTFEAICSVLLERQTMAPTVMNKDNCSLKQ